MWGGRGGTVVLFFINSVLLSFISISLFLAAEVALDVPAVRLPLTSVAVLFGVSCIILTHGVGGSLLHHEKSWSFYQPFKGGARFICLQVLSWSMVGMSLLLPTVPWFVTFVFPNQVFQGAGICAGAAVLMSELAMLSSLLSFRSLNPRQRREPVDRRVSLFLGSRIGQMWWGIFLVLQIMLSMVACGLCATSEWLSLDLFPRRVVMVFATASLAVSAGLTHGVGGGSKFDSSWRFFQPGKGGPVFVALQGLGWTVISLSLSVFLLHLFSSHPWALAIREQVTALTALQIPSMVWAGVGGVLGEILLAVSLLAFETSNKPSLVRVPRPIWQRIYGTIVVLCMFNTQNFVVYAWVLSFILTPAIPTVILAMWALIIVFYGPTYLGNPGRRGRRFWKTWAESYAVRRWFFDQVLGYFSATIVRSRTWESKTPLDADKHFVFGYHPHGITPIVCAGLPFTSKWKESMPLRPVPLTSSITHTVPLMRDIVQWSGGREVSRASFLETVKEHSVLVVPGGQLEMIWSESRSKDIVIITKHKGFVACAAETGCSLVPIFGFGETKILDNFLQSFTRPLQLFSMRQLRANACFLPYGAWGLFGVPRSVPVTCVIGDPIPIPHTRAKQANQGAPHDTTTVSTKRGKGKSQHNDTNKPSVPHTNDSNATPDESQPPPTQHQIDLLHRHYFTKLAELFEQHKASCGHADHRIVFKPPIEPLSWEQLLVEWDKPAPASVPARHTHHSKPKASSGHMDELALMGSTFLVYYLVLIYRSQIVQWGHWVAVSTFISKNSAHLGSSLADVAREGMDVVVDWAVCVGMFATGASIATTFWIWSVIAGRFLNQSSKYDK
eukprot:c12487_g1_i1.p1 GENE.c12487_g1_i1~~c12487_g1_i1.p1  ORF type:complete len:841 (+),score=118.35 c12487_g1_i1:30-2552(+)